MKTRIALFATLDADLASILALKVSEKEFVAAGTELMRALIGPMADGKEVDVDVATHVGKDPLTPKELFALERKYLEVKRDPIGEGFAEAGKILGGPSKTSGFSPAPITDDFRRFLVGELGIGSGLEADELTQKWWLDYWCVDGENYVRHTIAPGRTFVDGGSGFPLYDAVRRFIGDHVGMFRPIAGEMAKKFMTDYRHGGRHKRSIPA